MNEEQEHNDDHAAIVPIDQSRHAIEHRFELDRDKLELLKKTIAADADLSDAELQLFGEVATRKGLDPFAGQIHAVKRQGKLTFQTGIDGFRLIAQRSGLYAGQDAPEWCGTDGVWTEVWPKSKGNPVAARVAIYRKDWQRPVVSIAHWDEYVQTKYGGEINSMWKQRGPAQLAKCCEALGFRRAFPQDLSGIYTDDEMGQADNVIDISEPRQVVPVAPPVEVWSGPVTDMTKEVGKLTTDEQRDVLKKWWAETMPRADMPKGCKANAVPEHRVQELRHKIKELVDANTEIPTPDDDVIEAEIVEDDEPTKERTVDLEGYVQERLTPNEQTLLDEAWAADYEFVVIAVPGSKEAEVRELIDSFKGTAP